MAYEIQFKPDTEGVRVADRKAIIATLHYLGTKKFKILVYSLRYDRTVTKIQQVRFALMLAGVQGYPVDALVRRYRPDINTLEAVS